MSITVDDMQDKLLDLDEVRERLAATEPIRSEHFSVGESIRFNAGPNWNHGGDAKDPDQPIDVHATFGPRSDERELLLTRTTLEEICLTVGLPRTYVRDCPAELLVPHINYWFRGGLSGKRGKALDYQFLVDDNDTAKAFTKASMTPFSNLALLDSAVEQIRDRTGPEARILADYKFSHSLRQTTVRLVIPDACRVLTDTGTPDDVWSLGVQFRNSLTGSSQTNIEGYLFRWVCTNGQIDSRASSGSFTRRKDASQDEVYAWARQSVDDVLGGLEGALDAVQRLTQLGIEGSLGETLRDVFEHYRIPIAHRPKIIALLQQYDREITMYVVMNTITQVANDASLEPATVDSLLRVGGDLPHTAEQRCGTCHRMVHSH